jgi:hypothetical protein
VANSTTFHFGSSADDSLAGKTPAGRDAKGMQNVRFGSLADISERNWHVRLPLKSRHAQRLFEAKLQFRLRPAQSTPSKGRRFLYVDYRHQPMSEHKVGVPKLLVTVQCRHSAGAGSEGPRSFVAGPFSLSPSLMLFLASV